MTSLLYEDEKFPALIQLAAEATSCPPELIEKDYWICQVLRALATQCDSEDLIFKGGTSLSKAWKLIDRFSEDIDILIDANQYSSKSGKARRLSNIRKFIEKLPGLTYSEEDSFQGTLNADFIFLYPAQIVASGSFEAGRIKLEIGFRGGINPNVSHTINSILGDLAQGKDADHPDLQPFTMHILDTRRTFIEKLFAIYRAYKDGAIHKKTRHYYDVQRLYATEHILSFIETKEFMELCEDVRKNTEEFFDDQDIPSIKEIISSPAFTLPETIKSEIEAGFRDDRLLYYKEIPNIELIESTCCELTKSLQTR